jgi:quercetin dioxygenase-like cupin family protein
MTTLRRLQLAGALVAVAAAAYGGQAVTLDRGIREYTLPEDIQWRTAASGTATTVVYGDPSKPGLYVTLQRRPPNNWSQPHSHESDRYAVVLDGTFWVGSGRFDPDSTVPLKAGTVIKDFAHTVHYDGSRDETVRLLFAGIGPVAPSQPASPSELSEAPRPLDQVRQTWRLEDLKWDQSDASSSVTLAGDPNKPGLYLRYIRRKPHQWSNLHSHPTDRVIMVMGGRMHIGTGTTLDKARTIGIPKGGVIRDLAHGVHYDGSKDEDLWILIAGLGPATSTPYSPSR